MYKFKLIYCSFKWTNRNMELTKIYRYLINVNCITNLITIIQIRHKPSTWKSCLLQEMIKLILCINPKLADLKSTSPSH